MDFDENNFELYNKNKKEANIETLENKLLNKPNINTCVNQIEELLNMNHNELLNFFNKNKNSTESNFTNKNKQNNIIGGSAKVSKALNDFEKSIKINNVLSQDNNSWKFYSYKM